MHLTYYELAPALRSAAQLAVAVHAERGLSWCVRLICSNYGDCASEEQCQEAVESEWRKRNK